MKVQNIKNLIYASSSSVYGLNDTFPTTEDANTNNPISLYGGTKKANEVLVHSYHHLYKMNTIGLRFFTVYGPMGRPDMALFLFTKNILEGKAIKLFNFGNHSEVLLILMILLKVFSCCLKKVIFNQEIQLIKYLILVDTNL